MADTHIHIHLNGETVQAATEPTPSRKKTTKTTKAKLPAVKPKRAVSAYHKTVGVEMKKLKKAGFRGNLMKKAHANAKKKHSSKRRKK